MAEHTVGNVARLAGISVRTLHHYDEIGLLRPQGRSAANYRLYSADDLRRLRQVLFYRELGFGLDEIAQILAEPGTGTEEHLRRQHRLLRERQARTQVLLDAVERELDARRTGAPAAAYAEDEWRQIIAEAEANIRAFAAAIAAGEPPTGTVAMNAAEEHRAHLSRWFHACDHEQHREVAAAYLAADDTATWDEYGPGFSRYVHDAILANADRAQR